MIRRGQASLPYSWLQLSDLMQSAAGHRRGRSSTDIVSALDAEERGVWNLGTGYGYSVKTIAVAVLKACGRTDCPHFDHSAVSGAQRKVVDPDKALRELSWSPRVSLDAGVEKTVLWFKENQNKETK